MSKVTDVEVSAFSECFLFNFYIRSQLTEEEREEVKRIMERDESLDEFYRSERGASSGCRTAYEVCERQGGGASNCCGNAKCMKPAMSDFNICMNA